MLKFSCLLLISCLLAGGFSFSAENENFALATPEQSFASLTPEEKQIFETTRALYLSKISALLNKNKILFGSLAGSAEFLGKIKEFIIDRRQKIPEGEVGIIVRRLMQEEQDRLERFPEERKNLQQKGEIYIGKLLKSIDGILYRQAKVVCASDEIGLSLGVGLGLNAGLPGFGIGGLGEIEILFGLNRKTKTFVFELHGIVEKMKRPLTPLLIAGVDLRGGLYIKNSKVREIQRGESLFTPAIPTAFSGYPAHVDSYLSSGIAFPPMATELMGYISTSFRIPLIRIEVHFEPVISFNVFIGFTRGGRAGAKLQCMALLNLAFGGMSH